jgi:putative hydrolase of the HAD superfamily
VASPSVVLSDIGGVLLTNGWDHESRARAVSRFALDAGFEARHHALAHSLDCSTITLDDYLDRVVFDRVRTFTRADFVDFMKGESQPFPESLALLAELAAAARAGRFRLAALNNESRELHAYRVATFGLAAHFQVFFTSCYLQHAKPHPTIYARALEMLAVPAAACVFIDDRAENLEPAAALGIRCIRHTSAAETRAALVADGIAL